MMLDQMIVVTSRASVRSLMRLRMELLALPPFERIGNDDRNNCVS